MTSPSEYDRPGDDSSARADGASADHGLGALMLFVAPGFLHGMGNALFSIQGQNQLLGGRDGEGLQARAGISSALERATGHVEVLRQLLGEVSRDASASPAVLISRVSELLRVPLRERGLQLRDVSAPWVAPIKIAPSGFCRAVVAAVRAAAEELPSGCTGGLVLDLRSPADGFASVRLELEQDPDQLPFPLDWAGIHRRILPAVEAWGGALIEDGGIELRFAGVARP